MNSNLFDKYEPQLKQFSKNKIILSIIIFGSYAQNNIKPLSDLDIAIIFDKKATLKQKNQILSYGSEQLDISDFNNLPLSLQYNILVKGKIYHTKIDLTNLKINITNNWFDFRPILNNLYKSRGYLEIL